MLVSLDWIKDFVDVPSLSPQELENKFTMATAEVEEVIIEGAYWEKIKIAEITHIERHPNAEKLNLVTFKLDEEKSFRVVCGASNVATGLRVAFAPIGTTLPVGFTLEPKKIRGILSEGMLCSQEELGLEESSQGIWELPKDAPLGVTLKDYLHKNSDVILDIDNKSLTHRPDLWGHFGMAREFATIFSNKLNDRFNDEWEKKIEGYFTKDESPIVPKVESESSSLGYWGISMDNVEVKRSPRYIQNRLSAVGLRPINNIVDVSNYIMLELGIPMHIFDREMIEDDTIHIKTIHEDKEFVTLDEEKRQLKAGDTVISDSQKPLVIAGVMGGLNSGVAEDTTKIFIEVANWKAADIRRISTRLGLRTDSSMRYEKSLDSLLLKRTLYRAVELVKEFCPDAKVVGKAEYDGVDLSAIPSLTVPTSYNKISKVLGIDVGQEKIRDIFLSLGFGVEENGDAIQVKVPSFRATKDIEYEADLIEEIGRIVGYDNIPVSSPRLDIKPVSLGQSHLLQNKLKDFLTSRVHCYEVMTYPLVGEKLFKRAQWPLNEHLKLVNALSKDADHMRPSIAPQILNSVALNQKNYDHFKLFEQGRVYLEDHNDFSKENSHLVIAFYDKQSTPFISLVDTVEELMSVGSIPGDICERHPKFKSTVVDEEWLGIHPYEFLNIRIMGKMEGAIFSVHPLLLKQFKIKGNVSLAIINLTPVENKKMKEKSKYHPLPKFPGSVFDWTIVKQDTQTFDDLFKPLNKVKIKEMTDLYIVDQFRSGDITYVTMSASFLDPDKTLSGEFLNESKEKLIVACEKAGFPLKQ